MNPEHNTQSSVSHRPLLAEDEIPVLDIFQIESVREIMGESFPEIIDAFIATLPSTLEQLRHTLEQGELEAFGKTAHGLKGAAANMGSTALKELAREMEMAGKTHDEATAHTMMTHIEGEMQRAVDALSALI